VAQLTPYVEPRAEASDYPLRDMPIAIADDFAAKLPLDIHNWYEMTSQYPAITIEPLAPGDTIEGTILPGEFHQDPAARIIVAVARRYDATLVTVDEKIPGYEHVKSVS